MNPAEGQGTKDECSTTGVVDADGFVRELFSIVPKPSVAWLCTFAGDPKNKTDVNWTGFAHSPHEACPAINGTNAFYSIAAFPPGTKARRADEAQHAVIALVLDDVGTKADAGRCRELLGEPSFIVETSKDNCQWGYLPETPITASDIGPLHEAIKVLGAADPSGLNSVRYMRLPAGINGKRGAEFRVRLLEWHPERRYSLAYFQERLKVDPTAAHDKPPYESPDVMNEGERDDYLTKYAGYLYAKGMPYDEVLEALRDRNQARCKPPLPDKDIVKIARSIQKTRARGKEKAAMAEAAVEEDFAGVDPRILDELKALPQDVLILPSDHVPYIVSARLVFERLAKDLKLFVRGGRVVELTQQKRDSAPAVLAISILTPDALRSRLEGSKRRVKTATVVGTQLLLKLKRCSADSAAVLLATEESVKRLPPIELVTRSPILVEHEGQLRTLGHGYHPINGGIMVISNRMAAEVLVEAAVRDLLNLLHDFQFATPADKSRAVANFIGPCLRIGNLLFGHATINVTEADISQAGKGFLLATERSIYGETNALVGKRDGGVGSLDESLASALLSGAPFITFDNLRGRIASQYLELIMTSFDDVPVRVPHRGEIYISARHTTFHLTSNGFETTEDLGNRSMITRLVKQPPGYQFRSYPEGGLIQHVLGNQAHYLGCVFAVVKQWHAAGKPRLPTPHSFVEWIGTLDWIVQNLFKLPPLLDGHAAAIARVTNPGLSWLRQIAHVVAKQNLLGHHLKAMTLVEMSKTAEIEIPNGKDRTDDQGRAQQVGMLMAKVFVHADECSLDVYTVRRIVERESVGGKMEDVKYYSFQKAGEIHDSGM